MSTLAATNDNTPFWAEWIKARAAADQQAIKTLLERRQQPKQQAATTLPVGTPVTEHLMRWLAPGPDRSGSGQYAAFIAGDSSWTTISGRTAWRHGLPAILEASNIQERWADSGATLAPRTWGTTQRLLFDLDAGGCCHPDTDGGIALERLLQACERRGLRIDPETAVIRSSRSGGLHVVIALPEASSHNVAALGELIAADAQLVIRKGDLEVYPEITRYTAAGEKRPLRQGVRIPLQPGTGAMPLLLKRSQGGLQLLEQALPADQWFARFWQQAEQHRDLDWVQIAGEWRGTTSERRNAERRLEREQAAAERQRRLTVEEAEREQRLSSTKGLGLGNGAMDRHQQALHRQEQRLVERKARQQRAADLSPAGYLELSGGDTNSVLIQLTREIQRNLPAESRNDTGAVEEAIRRMAPQLTGWGNASWRSKRDFDRSWPERLARWATQSAPLREHSNWDQVELRVGSGPSNGERSVLSAARAQIGVALTQALVAAGRPVATESGGRRLIGDLLAVGRRVVLTLPGGQIGTEEGAADFRVRRRRNSSVDLPCLRPRHWDALSKRLAQLSEFESIHPIAAGAVALHVLAELPVTEACTLMLEALDGVELPAAYSCGAAGLLFHARTLLNRVCPVSDPALIPEEPAALAEGDDRNGARIAPLYGPAVDGQLIATAGVGLSVEDAELEAEQVAAIRQRYPRGTWVRDRFGLAAGQVTDHRIGTTKRGLRGEQVCLDGDRWVMASGVEIDPMGGPAEFEAPIHSRWAAEPMELTLSHGALNRRRAAAAAVAAPRPPQPPEEWASPSWMELLF